MSQQKLDVQQMIQQKKRPAIRSAFEKLMPILLFLAVIVSVLTTIGIIFTLIFETWTFFSRVSVLEYITSKKWLPFASEPAYGVLPLLVGTLKVTVIAVIVAVPLGLAIAIYLSEFATERVRHVVKPILEVLAGIPTIVYGFFALTFVTPLLQQFMPDLAIFNALSPGIVVGVMILPTIASLSEDALSSVPHTIREGAFGLGATKLEVVSKVILPAALSGVIASIVLAISRVIGETMIVSLAGGSTPLLNVDVTNSIQTMTAYIVQVATGDAGYGTTIYYSIYAVGFTLFLFTLAMNMLARFISKRFREVYE